MPLRSGTYTLTPPSVAIFVISLILAILAIVVHYFNVRIPVLNAARIFDVLAIAYVLLLAGVVFRRI